ncbi:hypothetical protein BDR26DRAFT_874466 [Obelidium mucronatum]|nr:hypothetical protein BDR26DRAFT_874466 [Obelidium mucronatum]
MINPLALVVAVTAAISSVAGGYLLLNPTTGPAKLAALADNAANIPVNRIYLSFVAPTMVYVPGSNTLEYADIGYSSTGDHGFAAVKDAVAKLQAWRRWNYNCYPYFYAGPNYWKITKYGGGSVAGCTAANMWCYVCEPESEGTTLNDFVVFPEPDSTPSWKAAQAQIVAGAKGAAVKWNPEIIGGAQYTDPIDKKTVTTVPGSNYWKTVNRDPYQDFVYLAKDLGLDGIDLDYEEMWHADTFRTGSGLGPFNLDQTVYKYTAITYDMINSIKAIYPVCKLSTAAGAAGAWSTKWWGGNLKGVWYYSNLVFMATGANAGGINVMTYDLSKNNQYFECPSGSTADCDLAGQVKFYMNTFSTANIPARVGYEIGQPAYPDPTNDPTNQIPLTQSALTGILSGVPSTSTVGGFFWELYKPKNSAPTGPSGQPDNIDATTAAQQICAKILPGAARCSGVIPPIGGGGGSTVTTTTTTTTTKPATSATKTTTTTTTTTKPASSVKTSTKTTTTTTTTTKKATTTAGSGPVVGQPCTQGVSQCSAGTMYYCQGSKWIVWYVGC